MLWVEIFNEISIKWNAGVLTQGSFRELVNGNPLQYSCLENPMDRGTWQAAVHGVAKSRTWLRNCTFFYLCMLKFRIWFSHFSVTWRYKASEKEVLMLILSYLSFHLQTDYSGNLKFLYPLLIQCLQTIYQFQSVCYAAHGLCHLLSAFSQSPLIFSSLYFYYPSDVWVQIGLPEAQRIEKSPDLHKWHSRK